MSSISLVKVWLMVSAIATAAGWFLSTVGSLNHLGYSFAFALSAACILLFRQRTTRPRLRGRLTWKKIRFRFARPAPVCFLVLAVLVFIGGVLYPPSNHTALTYRIPRVLHWLAEDHWHWI